MLVLGTAVVLVSSFVPGYHPGSGHLAVDPLTNWPGMFVARDYLGGLAMVQRVILLVVGVAIAGCFPSRALREGDAAATRGEWRAAERAYRRAVSEKPNDQEIARKYVDAKARAIVESTQVSEACEASGDLLCVDRELAYIVEIDPTNIDASTRRGRNRGALSQKSLTAARQSYESGDPVAVWANLDEVRRFGIPDGALNEVEHLDRASAELAAQRVQAILTVAAAQHGEDLWRSFSEADQLARLASARNPTHAVLVRHVEQLRQQALDQELVTLVATADQRLAVDDYAGAAGALETAVGLRPTRDLQRRARFARAMAAGGEAVHARAFDDAARAYRDAIATGVDPARAQSRLDDVESRVYRIRFDSIAVQPFRPGTKQPWVGKPWWTTVVPTVVALAVSATEVGAPFADEAAAIAEAAVNSVPAENRPKLALEIELPDRRVLRTLTARRGLYVVFDAEVYVRTNKLDARTLKIHVVHERSGGDEDVAIVNVPLGPIVAGTLDASALTGSAEALRGVLLSVEQAADELEGAYAGLAPKDSDENRASARSRPGHARTRINLDRIDLTWRDGADGWGSAEPYLKLMQDGQDIVKTTVGRPNQMAWTFSRTTLFVAPAETIEVRLMEADAADDDTIAAWTVAGSVLQGGSVRLSTAKGSHVDVGVTVVDDGPR